MCPRLFGTSPSSLDLVVETAVHFDKGRNTMSPNDIPSQSRPMQLMPNQRSKMEPRGRVRVLPAIQGRITGLRCISRDARHHQQGQTKRCRLALNPVRNAPRMGKCRLQGHFPSRTAPLSSASNGRRPAVEVVGVVGRLSLAPTPGLHQLVLPRACPNAR